MTCLHFCKRRIIVKFEGTLKNGVQCCYDCSALDKTLVSKRIDGETYDVMMYRCFGVREPFQIRADELHNPCRAYKDMTKTNEFKSIGEFVKLLSKKELKELKKYLELYTD